ncbi:MAG: NAD-binding protein [Spirochaetaceae bacterium]|nr:NAD-binding protein [Spirochaetaceae bacterium]
MNRTGGAAGRRRLRLPRASTWFALVIAIHGLLQLTLGVARLVAPEVVLIRNDSGDEVSGLARILIGILLVLLAKGLLERRRRAWIASLILSVMVVVTNAPHWIGSGRGIVALGVTVLMIAALLAFHRTFSVRAARRISYGQAVAGIAVALAVAYGIVGSYLLRDQFHGIDGWTDASYFALVAYSTLGYDYDVAEMYPVGSDARWFVVSLFLIGVTLFITALSVTLGPIVEGRMKGVMSLVKRFQRLSNHVVVCGYSGVAASVVDELRDRNVAVVIIDDRERVAQLLRTKGHDVLEGDPTLRDTLLDANVVTAQAVIASYDSDSMNTLAAVNAKDLRDDTPSARFAILVRIEDEENVEKVRKLGVDQVISPSTLGGRLLASRAVESAGERRELPGGS